MTSISSSIGISRAGRSQRKSKTNKISWLTLTFGSRKNSQLAKPKQWEWELLCKLITDHCSYLPNNNSNAAAAATCTAMTTDIQAAPMFVINSTCQCQRKADYKWLKSLSYHILFWICMNRQSVRMGERERGEVWCRWSWGLVLPAVSDPGQ